MKKIFSLILVVILSLSMFSCNLFTKDEEENGGGGGNTDNGGGQQSVKDDDVIFSPDVDTVIVRPMGESGEDFLALLDEISTVLADVTGLKNLIVKDSYAEIDHEIVIGDTDRSISADAKSRLDQAVKGAVDDSEDESTKIIGYTIYSNGRSVAVVWTDDMIARDAVSYFIDNFMTGGVLKLDAGYSKTNTFNYNDYLEEKSFEEKNAAWALLEAELADDARGAEVVASLKTLYSLYTPEMLSWLANLYDPDVGGFYHSNSARNTEGYLPDIASTWTALTFMQNTGMVKSWSKALPEDMKKSIGEFVLSLQDPDGYFYHPQWGKGISSDKREEHLKGAKAMLSALGLDPKYPYPGSKSTVSSSHLTDRHSGGATAAVSKVVRAAATLSQYESVAAYRAWLDEWYGKIQAGKTHFYSFGDELQSQVNNMRIYSEVLGEDLLKITTDFLTSHQRESGLWDDELNYTATNAIHKITSVYNSAKCEIPNADKIVEAGIAMISDDNSISACVDIYNAWSCISYVIENIRNYASGDAAVRNAKADAIVRTARDIAPEAIIGAFNKIEPFRKMDGSFSYGPNYSASGGAGVMTAVSHTVEGDLIGNSICLTSLLNEIYASLDIETFVPVFTSADYYVYMDILSGLGSVVKDTIVTESIVIDFEDADGADDIPTELNANGNSGSLKIETDSLGNKYLEYTAADGLVSPQNQPSLDINANKLTASPGYAVIEMELQYLDGHGKVGNQLMLYGSSAIIMQLGISTQSGAVVIKNSADSAKVLATAPLNHKFKLRIEYYWNEGFAAIYLNDDTLPSGVTTDLYPEKGIHQTFAYLHFGAARAQAGVTKIDNIKVEVRASKGEVELPEIKPKESETHGFEYSELGDTSVYPLTVNQGSVGTAIVSGTESEKYLEMTNVPTSDGYNPSVKLYSNDLKENVNRAVMQLDLNFVSSNGAIMYVYGTNKFITQLSFTVITSGGERYVIVKNAGDSTELLRIAADGWFTLKIEYYWNEGYFAFYLNDSETPDAYSISLPDTTKGHSKFDYVQLGASRSAEGVILVDNIIAETDYVDTVPEKPAYSGPVIEDDDTEEPEAPPSGGNEGGGESGDEDGDENETPEVGDPHIVDFNSTSVGTGISLSSISNKLGLWGSGSVNVVEKSEGNNALDMGSAGLWLYATNEIPEGKSANATVVEFTLNYTNSTAKNDEFYWRYGNSSNVTQMSIKSNTIRVYKADGTHSGWISLVDSDGKKLTDGTDIVLRFEYLWSGSLNVYCNGVLLIEALEVTPFSADFYRLGLAAGGTNTRTLDDVRVVNTYIEQ